MMHMHFLCDLLEGSYQAMIHTVYEREDTVSWREDAQSGSIIYMHSQAIKAGNTIYVSGQVGPHENWWP